MLLAVGAGSVFYWQAVDDLRPYALVQFLPMILIFLIVMLFPSPTAQRKYLGMTAGFYITAKLFEHNDAVILGFSHVLISGHSVKHLLAAAAVLPLICYMKSAFGYFSQVSASRTQ